MDSPNSLNPYNNMSLEDIIIAECTDDHDDQYFKVLMDGGSSTRQGKKRAHIDRGHVEGHQLGRRELSPLQKCTAAMRMLAYGSLADYVDEYVRIGETTAIECLVNFVRGVDDIFGTEYLRRPNAGDIHRLLQMGEAHGFPGMLGSIDCMHWEWKNCPVAWKVQFTRGDHGRPTIMLEVVASQDLWIWHAFFGVPGSNNDLNVLNQSPLFIDILQGQAPKVEFTINDTEYNKGYYLADGIYPKWGTFVKTIPPPQGEKIKLFARCQEAVCKDVERAFRVHEPISDFLIMLQRNVETRDETFIAIFRRTW
ncbi:uncharacterized protein LOC133814310 [Humulus lupulus]|uniref:uncharacterized protein LOC133814310 n=1 Tax=Humulus lupulus TaxID=3486 RepID=UPI002B409176|nr:uncharacterized protein LOC133814310 [Humulus lupulus]